MGRKTCTAMAVSVVAGAMSGPAIRTLDARDKLSVVHVDLGWDEIIYYSSKEVLHMRKESFTLNKCTAVESMRISNSVYIFTHILGGIAELT